nr:TMV resistance protein N-like isoform X2 [Quercus suber]
MSHLSELCLDKTAIKDLSLEHLTGLIKLDLRECKNLSSLPNAICYLKSLKTLTLSGCSKLDELPENLGNVESLMELDVSRTAITGLPSSVVGLKNLKALSLYGCEGLSPKSLKNFLTFPLMPRRRSLEPICMLERSLSGLQSLTYLDLSYCNLPAISDVLGCLSSLIKLNLTGNNFIFLPKSIIQLSNLKNLSLSGCMGLRLVPELPLNIERIDAAGCTSLETLSIRPEDSFGPTLNLLNCVKLIENEGYGDVLSTMLRHYLLNDQKRRWSDGLGIPGSEIPKWFSHQNVEASLDLPMPSDLYSKFMGIARIGGYEMRGPFGI